MKTTLIIMAIVAALAATAMSCVVAENDNGALKLTSEAIEETAEKESYAGESRGALTVTEGSMAIPAPGKFIQKDLLASAVKFGKLQDQPECDTLHCVDAPGADWCYKYPGCSYCNPETFKCKYALA